METLTALWNPALDKRGGLMIPRKAVVDSIECLQSKLDLVEISSNQKLHLESNFTYYFMPVRVLADL